MSTARLRSAALWLLIGLLACSLSAPARGKDKPAPEQPGAWLADVRRAAKEKDKARLVLLAMSPALDPWVAVDALHLDGAFDLAGEFADACTTSDAKALAVYARAVKDRALGAHSILARAAAAGAKGNWAEAVKALTTMPTDAPGKVRADALSFTGEYQMQQGLWREAAASYEACEAIAAQLGWHQGQLDALAKHFHALVLGNATAEQEAVLERRYLLAQRAGAELTALETRVWQGGLLIQRGRPRRAAALIRGALPRLTQIGADEYTAEAHGTLAQALAMRAELALALHHSHASGEAYARIGHVAGVLYARSAAIATYSELGLDEYVCELCKLQVRQAGEGPEHASERAHALLAWGIAEAHLDLDARAETHFDAAWTYFADTGDVESMAITHLNRGSELHDQRDQPDRARADYEAALALTGTSDRLRAFGHLFLADLLEEKMAAPHVSAALKVADDSGDTILEILGLAAASRTALASGRAREARDLARTATDHVLHGTASLGSEQSMGFVGSRGPLRASQALVRASLAMNDVDALFTSVETSRAITLLASMGGRSHVERAAQPEALLRELVATRDARRDADDALGTARDRRQPLPVVRKLRKRRDALVEVERGLEARLRGEQARIRGIASPKIRDGAAVRAWLEPHEAIVQLVVSDGDVHAIAIHGGGSKHVPLGPLAALVRLVSRLDAFRDADELVLLGPSGELTVVDTLTTALARAFALPPSVRNVVVVPPPELANLPWPLIGRATRGLRVTLCPSASVLLGLDHRAFDASRPRLAVGVTKYKHGVGTAARRVYARNRALPDLGNTATEARSVAGSKGRALVDAAATEEAVQFVLGTARRRRSIVHFACHGILDRKRPSLSSLALLPSRMEDGFLTGAEILGLRIDADLVVLSSCDTGSMAPVPGEGAVGLPGALLGAGASRVLANLWRVSDDAGPAFTRLFYAHLEKHGDPHAALQHAQTGLRKQGKDWAHPYYWAGWVLWGSPR